MKIIQILERIIDAKSGSKIILNVGFFLYETIIMTVLMLFISKVLWVKVLMVFLGLLASSFYLYSIMLIKTIVSRREKVLINNKINFINLLKNSKLIFAIGLYLSLAGLSFVSQYGLNLMLTSQENVEIRSQDKDKIINQKSIDKYIGLIDNIVVKQLNTNLPDWKYKEYERQRISYENEIKKLRAVVLTETNETREGDMFYYIEKNTGINRNIIVNYFLTILWFVTALGLFMSASPLKEKQQRYSDKDQFKNYVRVLFILSDRGRLQADKEINFKTGIPLKKCIEYREALSASTLKDRPIIVTMPGGAQTTFRVEEVLDYLDDLYGGKL